MATEKFSVYSFVGSQWAGVMHLALAEKGFAPADYDLHEVDLAAAENFDPDYLRINPNGTVPSLTAPSLPAPLTESTDILRHLDSLGGKATLAPQDAETRRKCDAIRELVHSDEVGTNLILFQARDAEEMKAKKQSPWFDFLTNRQKRLDKEHAADPSHPFYGPKAKENGQVHNLYATDLCDQHEDFYKLTHAMYAKFADGMARLDSLLVLPYAAGGSVTEADFHAVPWLAHAMWGAGTDPDDVQNFATLEALVQKSVPGFKVGDKTRKWWANVAETEAFKKVYPKLH